MFEEVNLKQGWVYRDEEEVGVVVPAAAARNRMIFVGDSGRL